MSIQSEISRISGNIADAYTAVDAKGGTLPATQNSDNLAAAIESISGGGGLPSEIIDISNTCVVMSDGSTPVGGNNYRMYAYTTVPTDIEAVKLTKSGTSTYCTYQYELQSTISSPTNAYIVIVMNDSLASHCKVGYFTTNPLEYLETNSSLGALGAHISSSSGSGNYPAGQPIVHFYDGSKGSLNFIVIETWDGTTSSYPTTSPSVYIIPTTDSPNLESITKTITSNTTTSITPSSNFYDKLGSVNITTNVSSSLNMDWYTYGGTVVVAGGAATLNLGSLGINRNTPFYAVFTGGTGTGSSSARINSILYFNGNGQSKGGFSAYYSEPTSSYCPSFNLSSCQINANGDVIVYFSTKYNPRGSTTAAAYKMPIFH